jgi:hypothetical protein
MNYTRATKENDGDKILMVTLPGKFVTIEDGDTSFIDLSA